MEYRRIDGFPSYKINREGDVLSRGRSLASRGHVTLRRKGVQRLVSVKQLLYETYVGKVREEEVVYCEGELQIKNLKLRALKSTDWTEIEGGYKINPEGQVLSPKGKLISAKESHGRTTVCLYVGKERKTRLLSRLVYQAFVGNLTEGVTVGSTPGYLTSSSYFILATKFSALKLLVSPSLNPTVTPSVRLPTNA